MPIDVQMPKLSDNMESGTIVRWLKQAGDTVAVGEPLAEVETDKADVELEATDAGVLREIRVAEGQSAAVGEIIAVLSADGEDSGESKREPTKSAVPTPEQGDGEGTDAAPAQVAAADRKKEEPDKAKETSKVEPRAEPPPKPSSAPVQASKASSSPERSAVRASPLAWRIAVEGGLDLSQVRGSGPGGRILKRDVENLLAQRQQKAAATKTEGDKPAPSAAAQRRARDKAEAEKEHGEEGQGTPSARSRVQPASRMRLTIAQRMSEANREIPHFFVTAEVDMSETWRMRQALKESGAVPGLTVTHIIVKAVALALSEHPLVNASWRDGSIEFYDDANIGIAVAVEDGLIVPVLHRAQELSLRDVSVRLQSLTEKARTGRFGSQDLTGATFSVSNLGILDVEQFTAVITPPQAAVLAVGTVKERPVVRAGALAIARTMHITLSCDHRVMNGVEGGEFLMEVKRLLESPYVLLMDGA